MMKLYKRQFCRARNTEGQRRTAGLFCLLAPSVIGACICLACLCSASWAWFHASYSAGTVKIRSATYTVSVTAASVEAEPPERIARGSTTELSLLASQTYRITIEPTGTAKNGYCRVHLEGKDYYTGQLTSGLLSFSVHTGEDSTLTVTPEWGTCAVVNEENKLTEGGEIGVSAVKPSDAPEQTAPDAATPDAAAPQPSAPAAAAPAEDAPTTEPARSDAPTASLEDRPQPEAAEESDPTETLQPGD